VRRWLAVALVGVGCGILAFVLLQPAVSSRHTARAQQRLAAEVPVGPAPAGPVRGPARVPVARAVGTGAALAVLRVPRFGDDWSWVAVEGTALDQLADGPGHYRTTPLPGARGNAAFAAHRAGHGDPFLDFDTLRTGDTVVVEQRKVRWTYRLVTSPRIVPVDATWVLRTSRNRELTLTTCWPRYGSSKRMYVRARLAQVDRQHARDWQPVWSAVSRVTDRSVRLRPRPAGAAGPARGEAAAARSASRARGRSRPGSTLPSARR
jgi:sortase A